MICDVWRPTIHRVRNKRNPKWSQVFGRSLGVLGGSHYHRGVVGAMTALAWTGEKKKAKEIVGDEWGLRRRACFCIHQLQFEQSSCKPRRQSALGKSSLTNVPALQLLNSIRMPHSRCLSWTFSLDSCRCSAGAQRSEAVYYSRENTTSFSSHSQFSRDGNV